MGAVAASQLPASCASLGRWTWVPTVLLNLLKTSAECPPDAVQPAGTVACSTTCKQCCPQSRDASLGLQLHANHSFCLPQGMATHTGPRQFCLLNLFGSNGIMLMASARWSPSRLWQGWEPCRPATLQCTVPEHVRVAAGPSGASNWGPLRSWRWTPAARPNSHAT